MWSTNADSLKNKLPELIARINSEDKKPDIIAITEVKVKNSRYLTLPSELNIDNYHLYHKNLDVREGRGIVIYLSQDLQVNEVNFNKNFQEFLALEVKLQTNDRLLLITCYRSPNSSENNNTELLDLMDEIEIANFSHLLMLGDFNYGDINWNTGISQGPEDGFAQKTADKIRDNYWSQKVTEPTRRRGQDTPHLLDLVIVNEENMIEQINHLSPLGSSDHCTLEFEYQCYVTRKESVMPRPLLHRANFEAIRNFIEQENWEQTLQHKTVEEQWNIIKGKILESHDRFVPVSYKTKKWTCPLNRTEIKEIKKKHRCWTRYLETRDPRKLDEYKRQRNKVKNIMRKGRNQVERNIAENIKGNPKLFWNYINKRCKTKSTIPDLEENRPNEKIVHTSDYYKAEHLNQYFQSVQTMEPQGDLPNLDVANTPAKLGTVDISPQLIEKKLKKLKISKSPGPDNIYPRILKESAKELSIPLCTLFQNSLENGTVPLDWKTASICAIHKKGPKNLASNYRPISLTSVISKAMESIIRDALMEHMISNHLFSNKQYGFINGRSTVSQLLKIIDSWTEAIDSGKIIESIYMDIKKAFDTVPHRRLLLKLEKYGIESNLLQWIKHFVTGRSQYVQLNGKKSNELHVNSGIPQGSVLGPCLFIVYINDLPNQLKSEVYMFADDTKLFRYYDKDIRNTMEIQEDLNSLKAWSDSWCLQFHPDKCKQVIISSPRMITSLPERYMEDNSGQKISLKCVLQERDLGIIFDSHLNFKEHIQEITNQASRMMGLIRRNFSNLTPQVFKPLYIALVRSRLEYGQSVWSPHTITEIKRIEQIQRRATKQINGFRSFSYPERLKLLQLPTLLYRRERGDMIEVFKILRNQLDQETSITLPLDNNITRGHDLKLYKRRVNLDIRKYSFPIRIVNMWNDLPNSVVAALTLNQFKNRLDKHWRNRPSKYSIEAN